MNEYKLETPKEKLLCSMDILKTIKNGINMINGIEHNIVKSPFGILSCLNGKNKGLSFLRVDRIWHDMTTIDETFYETGWQF